MGLSSLDSYQGAIEIIQTDLAFENEICLSLVIDIGKLKARLWRHVPTWMIIPIFTWWSWQKTKQKAWRTDKTTWKTSWFPKEPQSTMKLSPASMNTTSMKSRGDHVFTLMLSSGNVCLPFWHLLRNLLLLGALRTSSNPYILHTVGWFLLIATRHSTLSIYCHVAFANGSWSQENMSAFSLPTATGYEAQTIKRCISCLQTCKYGTPWKNKMDPTNGGLEDDFPLHLGYFRFNVNFPGCS